MVPEEWERKKLGAMARVTSGGTPLRTNPDFWEGDIPWITTSELCQSKIVDSKQKITSLGLEKSAAKLFPAETLLIAMYGQGRTRGQCSILTIAAATNQACAAIQFEENYYPRFYLQLFSAWYEKLRNLSNDGSQKNLSLGLLKNLAVPIPRKKEQLGQ